MRKTILAAVLVAVLAPSAEAEPKYVSGHGVLAGLQGVYVVVESLEIEESELRLTKDAVSSVVKRAINRSGIQLLSSQQREKLNHGASLVAEINVRRDGFFLTLTHKERVIFARDPAMKLSVATWCESEFAPHGDDPKSILTVLNSFAESFAKDYLRANPKNAPEPAKKK